MKKPLLFGVAIFLLLVGATVLLLPRPCPVSQEAFERIEEGMSRADVERILGGPPGDYRTRPTETADDMSPPLESIAEGWESEDAMWFGDDGTVQVSFDGCGAVAWKRFVRARAIDTGFLDRLVWRLKRRLGKLWPGT